MANKMFTPVAEKKFLRFPQPNHKSENYKFKNLTNYILQKFGFLTL